MKSLSLSDKLIRGSIYSIFYPNYMTSVLTLITQVHPSNKPKCKCYTWHQMLPLGASTWKCPHFFYFALKTEHKVKSYFTWPERPGSRDYCLTSQSRCAFFWRHIDIFLNQVDWKGNRGGRLDRYKSEGDR